MILYTLLDSCNIIKVVTALYMCMYNTAHTYTNMDISRSMIPDDHAVNQGVRRVTFLLFKVIIVQTVAIYDKVPVGVLG